MYGHKWKSKFGDLYISLPSIIQQLGIDYIETEVK
jgi:hypothetical protein